jgi:hypothetical protein
MARCDVCGNDYPLSFEVITVDGKHAIFDSIECAAQRLAPTCAHCGCRILGHGIQDGERFFCCASCSRHAGVRGAVDNTDRVGL